MNWKPSGVGTVRDDVTVVVDVLVSVTVVVTAAVPTVISLKAVIVALTF